MSAPIRRSRAEHAAWIAGVLLACTSGNGAGDGTGAPLARGTDDAGPGGSRSSSSGGEGAVPSGAGSSTQSSGGRGDVPLGAGGSSFSASGGRTTGNSGTRDHDADVLAETDGQSATGGGGTIGIQSTGSGGLAAGGATFSANCVEEMNGSHCGSALLPPGDENTRYFCYGEEYVAAAPCPAKCDAATGTCISGSGTSGGSGDGSLGGGACRFCWGEPCSGPSIACEADKTCSANFACVTSCDGDSECNHGCSSLFPEGALLVDLLACIDTNCSEQCPPSY